jgi:signal transduction histidine kinase
MQLAQHYEKTTDKLLSNKNEITRLTTALEYAQEAEQSRRQMVSNIAHELKTPLAIIHSYSEGLKERIAEEKREQYLDVILTESERMDAMVLEMLDLSRLEAGKVTLARDEFSLTELVQLVFGKLEMTAEGKELNITFDFKGDCRISADEARIGQVISNFAANAIKYTPHGGNVHVKVFVNRGKVFSVENDSKPFTNEELEKVWETFYQADNARKSEGAGLGLTIAKSIIELHGGKCFVRNTKTGVEFGFTV